MKLVPTCPPGRSTRKARGYSADIRALRQAGYTFEAIREALAAVGVQVSNRTVQREAARELLRPTTSQPVVDGPHMNGTNNPAPPGEPPPPVHGQSSTQADTQPSADRRSGKDVAEAFRQRQSTNPFIRAKEKR